MHTTTNSARPAINLGQLLGLRPLDRVQINNRRENAEMRSHGKFADSGAGLPYFYFQRVLDDGRLDVRSPNGYQLTIDPTDICDVVRGEPVVVRAMPERTCIQRGSLSLEDRQKASGDECYAEAFVLYVKKDRWGFVSPTVWFKDAALNGAKPWCAPVHDQDHQTLLKLATRKRMPVLNNTSSGYSADHNLQAGIDSARIVAASLVRQSLRGNKQAVEALTLAGIRKPDRDLLRVP